METVRSRRLPEIDYLAKDYASLRQLLLDQLSLLAPGWQERSPADLGQAVVEVLAYAADYLSYYQDAVATESYLTTARLRRSVRRHARLVDYHLHEGCNARTWVHFQLAAGAALSLPAGTVLLTHLGDSEARAVIGSQQAALADGPRPGIQAFETLYACQLTGEHNEIAFYVEGRADRLLPRGATGARLQDRRLDQTGDRRALDGLKVGDLVLFQELLDPATGRPGSGDPHHRHVVRLTGVVRSAAGAGAPHLSITWDVADALPFDLYVGRHHAASDPGSRNLEISVARGNLVLADHGWRIPDEALPPPRGSRYRPYLFQHGLTYAQPYDLARARRLPARADLQQDLRQAQAAVQLAESQDYDLPATGGTPPLLPAGEPRRQGTVVRVTLPWTLRHDLLSSEFDARHFVVESEDDGRAYLRFGFGGQGKQPGGEGRLSVSYRVGNGSQGNVGRETITHLVSDDPGVRLAVRQVCNPLPVTSGINPESINEARISAPHALKTHQSCVTAEDYAAQAVRHPAVGQARAQVQKTGSWTTALVYAQPRDGRPADDLFCGAIQDFLQPLAMSGHEVVVRGPLYAGLGLHLHVRLEAGYSRLGVRQAAEAVLSNRQLPAGLPGFFHPANLGFGQPIYRSQVIGRVMAVPGVAGVEIERFGRLGQAGSGDPIAIGDLEIARLDNDPDRPENGSLRLVLEGGR